MDNLIAHILVVDDDEGIRSLVKKYLDEKFNPSGFNIGINCVKVSGQTVDHLHIHIIPRYPKDVDDPTGGIRCVIPNKQKYK